MALMGPSRLEIATLDQRMVSPGAVASWLQVVLFRTVVAITVVHEVG